MVHSRYFLLFLALPLTLTLAGCYSDQRKQLASCEAAAPRAQPGQAMKYTQSCMDKAGYRFVGWNNNGGETIVCDMAAVARGVPSADGTDALCFEPKGWLALKIYRIEVPVKKTPPA